MSELELDVGVLSRRFRPMVLRRCQLLRDEDEALDASQDVFVFQSEGAVRRARGRRWLAVDGLVRAQARTAMLY